MANLLVNISGVLVGDGFDFRSALPLDTQLGTDVHLSAIILKIHIPPISPLVTKKPEIDDEEPLFGLEAQSEVSVEGFSSALRFDCEGNVFVDRLQLSGATEGTWALSVGASNLTLSEASFALNVSGTRSLHGSLHGSPLKLTP